MSEDDLALFLDSFDRCINEERFLDVFYASFLGSSPEVAAMFSGTDFPKQKRHLKASLFIMVGAIARRKADFSDLEGLSTRHRQMRIQPHHYELWLKSLLHAAESCTGGFDGRMTRVWTEAMETGIQYISRGGAHGAHGD